MTYHARQGIRRVDVGDRRREARDTGLAQAVLWDADPERLLERKATESPLRSRAVADDNSHARLCKEPWESSPVRVWKGKSSERGGDQPRRVRVRYNSASARASSS